MSLYVSATNKPTARYQVSQVSTGTRGIFPSGDVKLAKKMGHLHNWEYYRDTQGISPAAALFLSPFQVFHAIASEAEMKTAVFNSSHPFAQLRVAEDLRGRKQAPETSRRKHVEADSRKTSAEGYAIRWASTLLGSGNPKRNETRGWGGRWSVIRKPRLTWMKVTTNTQAGKRSYYLTCLYPCRLLWHKELTSYGKASFINLLVQSTQLIFFSHSYKEPS